MPQRTLKLLTHTDDPRPVYIAGTFNGWDAGNEKYRMKEGKQPGEYRYTFQLPDDLLHVEYKYTRGGWEGVELGQNGESALNHGRHTAKRWVVPDRVTNWANPGLQFDPALYPRIEIINENFEIPELIKTRRVAALLPHDYHETDRRYPVLYLQDGQNLYDDFAPYGSWGVDKRLAELAGRGHGDFIVIAIDHGEQERVSEYTPSFQNKLGQGEGEKYVAFLAETLKPYVDSHFRTCPGQEHTCIGGSSLGGLISILAGLMYPDVYDRLMIFSPSLWVTPHLPDDILRLARDFDGKVYLYGGSAESKGMVPDMERFRELVMSRANPDQVDIRLEIDPLGQHNEARWGREFPKAVEWLFYDHIG